MPDDEKTEVTEQETETEETELTTDDTSDESVQEALAGFNDDDKEEKPETEEEIKETEKDEKEEPAEESEEKAAPEKEDTEEEVEEPEEKEEVDEDEARGQEIIKDEDKKGKEALEAEEAEQKRLEEEEAAREAAKAPEAYSDKDIKIFSDVVSDKVFPDKVKVGDTELNLGEYLSVNPEAKIISSIVSKGVFDTLVRNNYIPSFKAMTDKIAELEEKVTNQRFVDKVTDPNYGVPKALEIYNSKKFGEWRDKQSDKVQALFRSDDPLDHVKGFKRFQKAEGLKEADKKVIDIDTKRKKAKEKADSIYKTTVRSKGKAQRSKDKGLSSQDKARDEGIEGFESEDES